MLIPVEITGITVISVVIFVCTIAALVRNTNEILWFNENFDLI